MSEDTFGNLQFATASKVVPGQPWPRYLARMVDTLLLGITLMFVLAVVAGLLAPERADVWAAWLDNALVANVAMFVVVVLPLACLVAFAQTPGKLLMGIRVRRLDGSRLDLATALKREGWVLLRGVGLGVPIVSLVTLVTSHQRLAEEGVTYWDKALGCRVEHAPRTAFWWIRAAVGGAIVAANFVANVLLPFTQYGG